ncbi:uncharacterized protein N7483_006608 [Penicillium malachiteum]|uniref:uncharacterized protein n=1 Tax=Penicillium malachiteum TaxID=1324776 RepID=UPI002549AAB7|nr:uncharacterized protein N7483_006608 [Penicillium malachiteum]KAJ5725251.1 hypothetical protein N7483_006608 [Penicillium malachiteum]
MNTTPEQILDIEDALHNYLVAYGWMARHKKDTPDLDAMAREKLFWRKSNTDIEAIRKRLIPSLNSFLDLIYDSEPSLFYWVGRLEMQLCDEYFPDEDNELDGKERYVVIYGTSIDLGPHCLGVVYDQQLHRASFPMTIMNWESIDPMDGFDEL